MSSYTQVGHPLSIRTPLGPDALLLTAVEGHEEISGLFRFRLTLLADRRTPVPFERVFANLVSAARRHPVVVQSLFFRSDALGAPARGEVDAWAARLAALVRRGGRLDGVQVYTVARDTMEPGVHPLPAEALEEIAAAARAVLPGVRVETYR